MKNFVCATLGRRIVLTLRNVNSWVGRKTHAFTPAIPLEEAIKRGRSRRGGGGMEQGKREFVVSLYLGK